MRKLIVWTVLSACLLAGCQKQKLAERTVEYTEEYTVAETSLSSELVIEPESTEAVIEILPDADGRNEPEPEGGEAPVTLLFAGDILLSDHVLNAYQKGGGIAGVLDSAYRSQIGQADFFFANEEFPFSDRGTQAPDKQYTFRLPPEKVSILQEMGVDGVSLANNHALDFGTEALLDTCETLDGAGIARTGAGHDLAEAKLPVMTEQKGRKIAIIGATRVIPVADWAAGNGHPGMLATYDPAVLLEEIRALSETADTVIVYVHWGIEREEKPEEYQRKLGQQYIDAGADLVIGSHPHVLQGIEYYQGKPIVYSLGNFVFGSSIPKTMLLEVTLSEDGAPALRILPGTSQAGYTQSLSDEGERKAFYSYMESISFHVRYGDDGSVIPQP